MSEDDDDMDYIEAASHLRTWAHMFDIGLGVQHAFTRMLAERDVAIARAEMAEANGDALAIRLMATTIAGAPDGRETLVEEVAAQMAAIKALEARAEAAEALAASRPEITPEDARGWLTHWPDVPTADEDEAARRTEAALRAHAAKVSR